MLIKSITLNNFRQFKGNQRLDFSTDADKNVTVLLWFIDDLEKVFKEICVHSSEDALNAAAFKRIGYSLNAGYAYDDRYGSVTNLFDAEIFNGDVVDMTSFDRRLTTLSAFGSALDKTKKSFI